MTVEIPALEEKIKLEEERHALAAFVKKFDQLGLGGPVIPPSKLNPPMPTPGGAAAVFAQRQKTKVSQLKEHSMVPLAEAESPVRLASEPVQKSLLEEEWDGAEDLSFEIERLGKGINLMPSPHGPSREILGNKENVPS